MIEFELWEVVVWLISNSVVAGLLASCAFLTDRVDPGAAGSGPSGCC